MNARPTAADLFDAVAETYDAVGVEFFGPIARGLVDLVDPQPGEHGLDVGCGRGAALLPLARAVSPGGSALGVDISPRMVELARLAVGAAGVNAQVELGDALDLRLEPSSIDVVVSSLVVFFLPEPRAALEQWRGLLRPRGRVGVSTFGPYDPQWLERVDAALARYAPADVRDARTSGARGPFASDAGMEKLLGDAGYRDVTTATRTVSPRFDDAEHWYRWSMSVGQRQFWLAIPPEELDAVRAALFAAVESCRDDRGRIGFDQQVRYTIGRR